MAKPKSIARGHAGLNAKLPEYGVRVHTTPPNPRLTMHAAQALANKYGLSNGSNLHTELFFIFESWNAEKTRPRATMDDWRTALKQIAKAALALHDALAPLGPKQRQDLLAIASDVRGDAKGSFMRRIPYSKGSQDFLTALYEHPVRAHESIRGLAQAANAAIAGLPPRKKKSSGADSKALDGAIYQLRMLYERDKGRNAPRIAKRPDGTYTGPFFSFCCDTFQLFDLNSYPQAKIGSRIETMLARHFKKT